MAHFNSHSFLFLQTSHYYCWSLIWNTGILSMTWLDILNTAYLFYFLVKTRSLVLLMFMFKPYRKQTSYMFWTNICKSSMLSAISTVSSAYLKVIDRSSTNNYQLIHLIMRYSRCSPSINWKVMEKVCNLVLLVWN